MSARRDNWINGAAAAWELGGRPARARHDRSVREVEDMANMEDREDGVEMEEMRAAVIMI